MTHALILTATPPRPARLVLDDDTWEAIGAAYQAGATAGDLAARYRISRTSIYRHASKRGWSKRAHGPVQAQAHAAAAVAAETEQRARRFTNDELFDLAYMEPLQPATLSHIATTAAGNAMMSGRLGEAHALANLARTFDRLARDEVESTRELAMRYAFDRAETDYVFSDAFDGRIEAHIKARYWMFREKEKAAERARVAEEDALRARVADLEDQLRGLGVEV